MGRVGRVGEKQSLLRTQIVESVRHLTGLNITGDTAYAIIGLVVACLIDATINSPNHKLPLNGIGECIIRAAKHKYVPHGNNRWRDMGIPFMPKFSLLLNDVVKEAMVKKMFTLKGE